MSKLLSDEELYEKLEEMHYKLENTQHTNWDEYTNTLSGFTDLINTQKLLYAESVIREDKNIVELLAINDRVIRVAELLHSVDEPLMDADVAKELTEVARAINNWAGDELRAEQRSRLNDTK